MISQPMLAAPLLPSNVEHTDEVVMEAMRKLRYPVAASVKKDGIRGFKWNDLLSRTFKLIPNKRIRERALILPDGFDMELCSDSLLYNEVESIVMSFEHERSDEISFYILDWFDEKLGYKKRLEKAWDWCVGRRYQGDGINAPFITICNTPEELFSFEQVVIDEKGEGICFRTLDSPYKEGRSTLREQWLVKLARYVRTEATIINLIEQEENTNSERRNAVGKMDRSKSKDGMVGKNTLGAFIVTDDNGQTFRVGTGVGLTAELRKEIWMNQDKWMGRRIVIKHKPHGRLVKPRSPIYVGCREKGY